MAFPQPTEHTQASPGRKEVTSEFSLVQYINNLLLSTLLSEVILMHGSLTIKDGKRSIDKAQALGGSQNNNISKDCGRERVGRR